MKRAVAALVACLAAVAALLAPASPAAAATSTNWSTLADGQHLAFDPAVDVLNIDDSSIAAAEVRLVQEPNAVAFTAAGKTIHLDGLELAEMRPEGFSFADQSQLLMGELSSAATADGYSWITEATSGTGDQLNGLGGSDLVYGWTGPDRLIGTPARTPFDHVSRTAASGGSPTASTNPSVSADGTKVAFEGGWTGFGSTNDNATDVLIRDVANGTVTNEHKNYQGLNGLSGSGAAQISADGRYVTFVSSSQLVSGASPSNTIWRADTATSAVVPVSTASNGTFANGFSGRPDISADGRYVVFLSPATNLATGSSGTVDDVFLKDLQTGETTRLSTSQSNGDANADALTPRISPDGNAVVWASAATDLTATETGGGYTDIYLWQRGGGLTNLTTGGTGTASSRNPDVSDGSNGVKIAFESDKKFAASDTNATTDVYLWEASNFTLVSATKAGAGVALASTEPSVSGDGIFVAFRSFSDALVPGDAGSADIFVKNTYNGDIARVSAPPAGGQPNQTAGAPEISRTGAYVAFESGASNLAATDGNGGLNDVFLTPNPIEYSTMEGDRGDDTYVTLPTSHDVIVEKPGEGNDTIEAPVAGTYTLPTEVERFVGTPGVEVVHGNAGNNRLDPGDGADLMYETAGNDTFVASGNTDNIASDPGAGGTDTVESPVAWTLLPFLENLTLTGSAAINGGGNSGNNVLTGNSGANTLTGYAGADTYTGGSGGDQFSIDTSATVDAVTDFTVGTDRFRMSMSAWHIGDSDLIVEGATNRTGPGGFSKSAEYVVISKNLTSITTANAAAAIGSATSSYATGDRRLFMVDNGTSSELFLFISSSANASVSAAELKPLMLFKNRNAMSVTSALFAA